MRLAVLKAILQEAWDSMPKNFDQEAKVSIIMNAMPDVLMSALAEKVSIIVVDELARKLEIEDAKNEGV